jgi:hypothetical protein
MFQVAKARSGLASNRVYCIGEVDRPAIEAPPDVSDLNAGLK